MRTKEIRDAFLAFFREKEHLILPSFSLVPERDPSLLLIGAGMAPLKPYFTGEKAPLSPRIATCQKCIRTPDIEKVGKTSRHATFFEMLGNFSFGNYFKEETIKWAWELVTDVYKLPKERLWISVYEDDDEAFTIWNKKINIPSERIVRLGKEDNFWEIGLGPCGPCSEIYYDLGAEYDCGFSCCKPGCDCDRYLEIWNLVFTQFSREKSGELLSLAQKNIDTGAGLERLATVLQGVSSIYETDTVKPLLDYFIRLSSQEYGADLSADVSLRIVTEHMRTVTFLIADGVMPSNEGRGYILRRILRRAVRHGHLLGLKEPFLYLAVPEVVSTLGDFYVELCEKQDYIQQIIKLEEIRFQETLSQGMEILEERTNALQEMGEKMLPGATAFKLYDTFGFPLDLTREILAEKGLKVDEPAFERALQEQRERARSARLKQSVSFDFGKEGSSFASPGELVTHFSGYDSLDIETEVIALVSGGKRKDKVTAGTQETVHLFLEQTPFYAERGGQVGDIGIIQGDGVKFKVKDTKLTAAGQFVHEGELVSGEISVGDTVRAMVEVQHREKVRRSHTATHLLHQALRDILGKHVTQAGSLVAPDRLRFDFPHFTSLSEDGLQQLEELVNSRIWDNLPVELSHISRDEALKMGAIALFEDKYSDKVRVVKVDNYSIELCGGTHVCSTGAIGIFIIVSETGIGAGLRRIEALTGKEAYRFLINRGEKLDSMAKILKTSPEQAAKKLEDLLKEHKELQKQCHDMQQRSISLQVADLLSQAEEKEGITLLSAKADVEGMDALRSLADQLKERLSSGVIVLGAIKDKKVFLVTAVSGDLVGRGLHAGRLIGKIAKIVGGGGGGRPEMAEAGGKNPGALAQALVESHAIIKEQIARQAG